MKDGRDTTRSHWNTAIRWICPRSNIVTERLVTAAHAAGLLVYAYHVNDPDTAAKLISWGIDAVGTDHPEMMLQLLSPKTGD
ncbi:MAG: glycerophosphodiester phosphodiesterase [Candidatus Binatia bacterium]